VTEKILIVNADDFGRTPNVNAGIIRAHEHGIVTSATAMVRWPAAVDAAAYARRASTLDVGLHLDLGEWEFRHGAWTQTYEVVPVGDEALVAAEIERQLDQFVNLFGRPPTHLDSHQHVHQGAPVRGLLRDTGEHLGVPVRDITPGIGYRGDFYGQDGRGHPVPQAITVTALERLIRDLPPTVTELGCHPGEVGDLDSVYLHERAIEVETLCSPRVRRAIEESSVVLRGFAAWPGF
jgi:chitin disaccharide deacetylase